MRIKIYFKARIIKAIWFLVKISGMGNYNENIFIYSYWSRSRYGYKNLIYYKGKIKNL